MKSCLLVVILLSCMACAGGEKPRPGPSKRDRKLAAQSFQHALRLQKEGKLEPALEELSKAATLEPGNQKYAAARELLRSRIASDYIERGNRLVDTGDAKAATKQFESALTIDPGSSYAEQRLHDVAPDNPEHEHVLQLLASVEDVSVTPNPGKSNFHIQGDTRQVYDAIGHAFGVVISYEPSLGSHRVRFDVDDLDFYSAMRLAGKVTRTFWAPVGTKQVIVANDTQEMHRQYDRFSLQTFYVGESVAAAEVNDIANILRTVFEVKLVSVVAEKKTITVRAPTEQMQQIAAILDDVVQGRPEIMLDVKLYELDYNKMQQYGLSLPNTFSIFNVFAAIYAALGPNAQQVINQLQQTGTINPASVPLTSLQNLQNSPLLQPFLFFGKGYGLTGFTVPTAISGQLSNNVSYTSDLEHVSLRTTSGSPATMMVGTRFPISLSSFTNLSITTSGQPQVGTAIPQFQYEDLGVIVKATPHLQSGGEVNLELQLQVKGLGAQNLNGAPVLTNRDYKGFITVQDGEPTEIAGIVEEQADRTGSGYPGVGPVGSVLNTNSNQHTRTEILVVLTPHIIRKPVRHLENVVWGTIQ
jgi:general secretion pathway protein D